MAAIVGNRTQIGVRETGTNVTIPNNDTARLMYYLDCMCSVLDLNSEQGLDRLRDYSKHYLLSDEDKAALLLLCIALNPLELNDKCIFAVPAEIARTPNQFLELSATETNFIASNNVLIGGQSRKVKCIMIYTMDWIQRNYLNPLENLTNRLTESQQRQPQQRTQITYTQSSSTQSEDDCCCTIL